MITVEEYLSTSYDPLRDPAYPVVEVLSGSDITSVVVEKLREYDRKGVPNIWLIDPRLQVMSVYRHPSLSEVDGDMISTGDRTVELSRGEIFPP